MARILGQIYRGFQRLVTLSSPPAPLRQQAASVRTSSARTALGESSLPNSSWGSEMMRLYQRYNSQRAEGAEGGDTQEGLWQEPPSCAALFECASGEVCLSMAHFMCQNTTEPGAAFEHVVFVNAEEQRSVCIFQAGHLLEGLPGHVHGGAIATMIDYAAWKHTTFLYGLVMTANLNINYRSPIPLGSTVVLESSLDKKEGRKTFIACKVTSSDGSKLHTEATALFLAVSANNLQRV